MTPALAKHMHALMQAIDRMEHAPDDVTHVVMAGFCAGIGQLIREQAAREGLLEGPPLGSLADADLRDYLGGGR